MGSLECAVRWSNTNSVPVYGLVAELDISDNTRKAHHVGVVAPGVTDGSGLVAGYRLPNGQEADLDHPFPTKAGCSFADSAGRRWRRLHDGTLLGPMTKEQLLPEWPDA